ncbi:MAG: hypothetical protein KY469_08890 [Actinobacteria bacterium]|nr:hypothetical protein [Actinomycetota bacterium]
MYSVDEPPLTEWSAEVGFFTQWEPPWGVVLGQQGFFDRFTVTMSRLALALALEDRDVFDARFEDAATGQGSRVATAPSVPAVTSHARRVPKLCPSRPIMGPRMERRVPWNPP